MLRLSRFRFWAVLLWLAWPVLSPGGACGEVLQLDPSGAIAIEADRIAYDADGDTFQAEGQVTIRFSGGNLQADRVTLHRGTNQALAVGRVRLQSDQDILEGERLSFHIASKTGTVDQARMFVARNHLYIRGEKIEKKGEATYRMENGSVTSCDGDDPDWRLAASEVHVTVDGYGTLRDGRFLARDLPLLYLPYLVFPAKTTRQTGLLFPRFAYSRDKNGFEAEVPFYWAISGSADATFYQHYMEKRGFKEGVEFRYATGAESSGLFYGDFIHDRRQVADGSGSLSRDWQEARNRWSYYFNHETQSADGFGLRSDLRRVSDRWYFRDFTSFNYYLDHQAQAGQPGFQRIPFLGDRAIGMLDSTVRVTRDWSLHNLTALARYTDDFSVSDNSRTLQKYPEVILTGFRRPLLGSPLQLEFSAGFDHLYRQEGQKGHLWAISPTLLLPLQLGPYRLTPQAGVRGDLWQRSDSAGGPGERQGSRQLVELGSTLSTELERVYELRGSGTERIRHGIRPEIVYRYTPSTSQQNIPDFLDPVPAQNSVAYSVTNTLLARERLRDGTVRYRETMRFKVGQTFDIREARRDTAAGGTGRRPFGDVDLELDLSPLPQLSLAARNIYDVNSGGWLQQNYDLRLSNRRGDMLSAGYRYTRDRLEEINLSLKAAVTESLGVAYLLKRSQRENRTIESSWGLQYRRQCWNVELNLSDRVDDRTVMVVFSLYGLGI